MKPEWQKARRTLASLDSKLERLKTLFVEGAIDETEYQKRKAKINAQQTEATRLLQDAPLDVKVLEGLLSRVDELAAAIRHGEPVQQRAVLTALFELMRRLGPVCTGEIIGPITTYKYLTNY